MGLNQQGMAATGAQVGTQAQGLQGQLGARTSAYGGEKSAAGTIGQGDIAAANARAAGSQNIMNTGMKVAGMALSAATGMPIGMGSSSGVGGSNFGAGQTAQSPAGYANAPNYPNPYGGSWYS
jgi:hypothetical protein